jgi:hypothetical protein
MAYIYRRNEYYSVLFDYYRYYYTHLIVSYGNGGNKLFVLFVFVTHAFYFCLENCLVTLSTLHLQYSISTCELDHMFLLDH